MYILYCSRFLPYINYCSKIWGNIYVTNITCVAVLQKRVVGLICGTRHLEHTSTLFKQLRIFLFLDLVKFKTAIIVYKAYHNVLQNIFSKTHLSCMFQHMVLDREIPSEVIVCIPT